MLFFYTDGLSEAHDEKEEEYGENRIIDYLKENRHLSPEELKNNILESVEEFSCSNIQEDDTTIVILKVNGLKGNE